MARGNCTELQMVLQLQTYYNSCPITTCLDYYNLLYLGLSLKNMQEVPSIQNVVACIFWVFESWVYIIPFVDLALVIP